MKAEELDKLIDKLEIAEIEFCKVENKKTKLYVKRNNELSIKEEKQDLKEKREEKVTEPTKITEEKIIKQTETEPTNEEDDNKFDIISKHIGFFFRNKGKSDTPLVKLREVIDVDQVVAIVRVLNIEEEIIADKKGKIVEILVEDGQPVEYGQPLMRLIEANE